MDQILAQAQPLIAELVSVLLTVITGIVAFYAKRFFGIEIEKRHREALHEALISGAMSAIEHGPGEAVATLKAHAIAHARRSVPQAIAALVPGDTVLDAIADRYVHDALRRLG